MLSNSGPSSPSPASRATATPAAPWHPALPPDGELPPYTPPPSPFWQWLQDDFPWLASPARLATGGLVLVLLALAGMQAVSWLSKPPAEATPRAQRLLKELLVQVEEARGAEALLMILPAGAEREAALSRLVRQQREIVRWQGDNGAWLLASQGRDVANELRQLLDDWRKLQMLVTQSTPLSDRNGQPHEARNVSTGPSAAAYRNILQLLERLVHRQPG